jgi:hypothetical protein
MRGFFSSQPAADDPPPATATMPADGGGWAGLSGRAKLGIMAGVAAAAIVAVLWPNLTSKPGQPPSGLPNQHAPAPISDYQAPPPVEDVANRVTGNPPPRTVTRTRPMPTEMALYTVKAPPSQMTAAAATGCTRGSGARHRHGWPTGDEPCRHGPASRFPDPGG